MPPEMEELIAQVTSPTKVYGKYRGKVVNNVDPLQKGRLQVLVPSVLGVLVSWALPCVPYAGAGVGFYFMPELDTSVWVEFEGGDPDYPIWSGCFWNDGDIDPADADPQIKFIKTKKFKLRIDDGTGEIIVENDSGSQVKLTAQEILIKSSSVTQEVSASRKTELTAASFRVNNGSAEVL